MRKHFYMWFFFGLSVTIIVGIWLMVVTKTIRYSLGNGQAENNQVSAPSALKELELKLKTFQEVNKLLFEEKAAEAQELIIREAALQKVKEKLENASSSINGYELRK